VAASTHKKIVYAGFGCAGVFVAFAIVGLVFMRGSGWNIGIHSRAVSPTQAAEALALLMRNDLTASLPSPPPDVWRPDPIRVRGRGLIVYVASPLGDIMIPFGDTFPAGSLRRSMWFSQADGARVTAVSKTSARPILSASLGLAASSVLLARARQLENRGDIPDALLAVESVADLGHGLQIRGELREFQGGLRIERDAATMLAGDSALGGDAARRSRAHAWAFWADSVARRLSALSKLIVTAGAGPSCLGALAELVEDARVPLATRRAILRTIVEGWVNNPVEKTYGLAAQRDSALRRLSHAALPAILATEVAAAIAQGTPNYIDRLRIAAEIDQARMRFDVR
jgi:hypothetical protein